MNSYPRLKSGVRIEELTSPTSGSSELYVGLPAKGVRLYAKHADLIIRAFTGVHSTTAIARALLLPLEEIEAIVEVLTDSELLELWPSGLPSTPRGIGGSFRSAQYEIQRDLITHRAGTSDGGVREMKFRSEFTILISGENRLARTLLTLLQSMGITHSRIITRGQLSQRVDSYDVCGVTTRMSDIGKMRSEFHQELIRESELPLSTGGVGSEVKSVAKPMPDLIISTIPIEWDYVQRWMSEGSAHLHINSLIGGSVEVGPYVVPGSSACLRCVALTKRDVGIRSTEESLRKELPAAASAHLAGLVAAIVGELIATGTSDLYGSSLWLNLLQPLLPSERRYWQTHPECGCADN